MPEKESGGKCNRCGNICNELHGYRQWCDACVEGESATLQGAAPDAIAEAMARGVLPGSDAFWGSGEEEIILYDCVGHSSAPPAESVLRRRAAAKRRGVRRAKWRAFFLLCLELSMWACIIALVMLALAFLSGELP